MREQRNHAVGLHERVIEAARGGDWDVLADYLNAGFEVTPDVRRLLIAILRREVKKPPKRTAKAKTATRDLEVAAFVFWLRQNGDDAIAAPCSAP